MTSAISTRAAGAQLREWRTLRRLSQMDLANMADVSTKHLSHVETGRSTPSPEMVLHLCRHLDVPLREQNAVLLAAGHAPRHRHLDYAEPAASELRSVVGAVLSTHRYPAVAVDGSWSLVEANAAAMLFLTDVAPRLLEPPINVIRLSLHAEGLAPRIANFDDFAGHIIGRIRRLVEHSPDATLVALLDEFDHLAPVTPHVGAGLLVPLRFRIGDDIAELFSTITTFGSPREVTLSELAIETFHPSNAASAALLDAAITENL